MALAFPGNYRKLQKAVRQTGLSGKWRELKYGRKQYRTDDGGCLNWWKRTGTITFEGSNSGATEKLEQVFIAVASAKRQLLGEYGGRVFHGRFRNLNPDRHMRHWLAIRKQEGLKIDPETAEVDWDYVQTFDPYGVWPDMPEKEQQVERGHFARSPGSNIWVHFRDLTRRTAAVLWKRHKAKLVFPAGLA
jgi:hypothetical protein